MIQISIKISLPSFIGGLFIEREDEFLKIQRRTQQVEISFPVLSSKEVKLAAVYLRKNLVSPHDRSIFETIEILNQIYDIWMDPHYDLRVESEEILSLITGQSKQLIHYELEEIFTLFKKDNLLQFMQQQFGNPQYLDEWIKTNDIYLHAQPRGLILHNLAGNSFVLGPLSLLYGILTKNVNLAKLASSEPYFAVRFVQSIYNIDKKLAKELAVLYWKGSQIDIYQFLFKEELIDLVIAWGGYSSITDLKRTSAHYGVKFIEHGPKFSFTIITEDFLGNSEKLTNAAREISKDITIWNQYACVSPRIIFVQEKEFVNLKKSDNNLRNEIISFMDESKNKPNKTNSCLASEKDDQLIFLISESMASLRKIISYGSAFRFAQLLSQELDGISKKFARTQMTEAEALEILHKRDYYLLNVESNGWGKLFVSTNSKSIQNTDWTVFYLRKLPTLSDINACVNRFVIVTSFESIEEIENWIKQLRIQRYIQTFSILGKMDTIKTIADRLSLLGACVFTLPGEMNIHNISAPHDGSYDLKELVRWVSVNRIEDQKSTS